MFNFQTSGVTVLTSTYLYHTVDQYFPILTQIQLSHCHHGLQLPKFCCVLLMKDGRLPINQLFILGITQHKSPNLMVLCHLMVNLDKKKKKRFFFLKNSHVMKGILILGAQCFSLTTIKSWFLSYFWWFKDISHLSCREQKQLGKPSPSHIILIHFYLFTTIQEADNITW